MTDEELKALRIRTWGIRNTPRGKVVMSLLEDLEEARDLLATSEALKTHFEEEYSKARALAFEEAARWHDAESVGSWDTIARSVHTHSAYQIRALATLPPTLVAVEKETIEKVRVALQVGMAGLSGEAGEFIREAFALLVKVKP